MPSRSTQRRSLKQELQEPEPEIQEPAATSRALVLSAVSSLNACVRWRHMPTLVMDNLLQVILNQRWRIFYHPGPPHFLAEIFIF